MTVICVDSADAFVESLSIIDSFTVMSSNFSSLSSFCISTSKVRNKVKEFVVLLKANSLPVSVERTCPVCPEILIKNHVIRCQGLNQKKIKTGPNLRFVHFYSPRTLR
eukprot:TRINITY_DN2895_c0_g1_i6.p2 TRINITY_DN2895_c0_g1~~TRINITY_DN2895_c0_g1_i6.p2  ORF type:complete len:108 (-),score=3.05 TRINITY_DN2895_c0_g1_i6:55-378(-)